MKGKSLLDHVEKSLRPIIRYLFNLVEEQAAENKILRESFATLSLIQKSEASSANKTSVILSYAPRKKSKAIQMHFLGQER